MVEDRFVLYSYWRSSCSWRVRIALAWKGIQYEYRAVNLLKGEHKDPEYLRLNPSGMVPTLVIEHPDGRQTILSQSTAILEYLEEAYPALPSLLPSDPLTRAHCRALYNIIAADTQPLQNPFIMKDFTEDAKQSWGHDVISKGFGAFEAMLQSTAGVYCCGDGVTMADAVLVPMLDRYGVRTGDYPNISEIAGRLAELPAFMQADGKMQPDYPHK